MQYCSLQHQSLLPPPVTFTTGCCFCIGSASSFFPELFLCFSPLAYWAPTNLGSSSFSSVQFSGSVMSDSLRSHELQHARLPCPSLSPSLVKLMSIESVMPSNHLILCCPLLLLPSTFPVSESFPMNQFFASGGQSVGVSASASVLPMNIQGWFPLGLTPWSPCSPRDSFKSLLPLPEHLHHPPKKPHTY